jgi:hypothetical protein
MQSRHLRHGHPGRGAQLSTLIASALADIAMCRTDTDPLNRMALHTVPMHTGKFCFLPGVGAYYPMKVCLPDHVAGAGTGAE